MKFIGTLGICAAMLLSCVVLLPNVAVAQAEVIKAAQKLVPVQKPPAEPAKNGAESAAVPKCKDGVQVPVATVAKGQLAIAQYCRLHGGVS